MNTLCLRIAFSFAALVTSLYATSLQTYNTLNESPKTAFILSPQQAASTPNIFVKPNTETLIINPVDPNFEKEISAFKAFKERYGQYWMLYNLLLINRVFWL